MEDKLNFKESEFIRNHRDIISKEFIESNIDLFSHSLTSRHFQFFVKNIPIKEQADKV